MVNEYVGLLVSRLAKTRGGVNRTVVLEEGVGRVF